MPHNNFYIATKSSTSKVFLFDYSKHSSGESKCKPELTLEGHEKEGYGLSWSHRRKGHLLSGSDDGLICLYDVNQHPVTKTIQVCLDTVSPRHNMRDSVEGR